LAWFFLSERDEIKPAIGLHAPIFTGFGVTG
jgi:hypothetical protein